MDSRQLFVNEDWLKQAIEELDTRKMTVEERYAYEYAVSANAEVINAEKRKVANLLALNILTIEQIANSLVVSVDFVLDVQKSQLVS
jgi:hypothetical protein